MTYDLIVVGAGPAGSAAAISAAKKGATVLLLERSRFPRHKVCGEFVSAESLDLLRDLLIPAQRQLISNAPRIARGRIFADGAVLDAEITPPAASIPRFDLDAVLWDSCRQSGVETREECVVQIVEGDGPFTVITAGGSYASESLINATGRWSNLTSAATRACVTAQRWIGIKAHLCEPSAAASVDLYFFESGYCGVQPISAPSNGSGTRINACAMVRSDIATTLPEVLHCHPALLERSRSWEPLMQPVSTAPLVFHEPEPLQRQVLQVGDAATFVDPFIGDGISLALRSGNLAAHCLQPFLSGKCSLQQAAESYRASYQRELAPVFRASSWLRRMLGWPAMVRKPVLSLLEKAPSITRQLVRMTR